MSTILWSPPDDVRQTSRIGAYLDWLSVERNLEFASYDELWQWSSSDLGGFWSSVATYFDVRMGGSSEPALGHREMPGAQWFPQAQLNYVEQVFRPVLSYISGFAVLATPDARKQVFHAMENAWELVRPERGTVSVEEHEALRRDLDALR